MLQLQTTPEAAIAANSVYRPPAADSEALVTPASELNPEAAPY